MPQEEHYGIVTSKSELPNTVSERGGDSHSVLRCDDSQQLSRLDSRVILNADKQDDVIVLQKRAAIALAFVLTLAEWYAQYHGHPPQMLAWGLITGVFGGVNANATNQFMQWVKTKVGK